MPIPKPCRVGPQALTPTVAGGHCARRQTEAVDFTRLEAEGRACRAERPGLRGCASRPALAVLQPCKPPRGLRCWLLAVAALVGWQPVAAQVSAKPTAKPERFTISGTVLDDSLQVPAPGLWLYLNGTKYGAITNAQGAFSLSFPTEWKPVRGGVLLVQACPVPYTFKPKQLQLDWRSHDPARPVVLRLASARGRGRPNLHGFILKPPPVPPPTYPPGGRTIRP